MENTSIRTPQEPNDEFEEGNHASSSQSVDSRVGDDLDDDTRSRVEYFGFDQSYCGYCKPQDESVEARRSHGMRAKILLPDDYQQLLDFGWRRSGTYCYNPINQITCCPNYPILCQASEFKPSRSQRQCISNLLAYLVNENISEKVDLRYRNEDVQVSFKNSIDLQKLEALKRSTKARARRFVASCERKVKLHKMSLEDAINNVVRKSLKRRVNLAPLEDYLYPKINNLTDPNYSIKPKHGLEIRMLYVDSEECKSFRNEANALIKRYQKSIHNESESEWNMSRFCGFLVETPLAVGPIRNLTLETKANNALTTDAGIGNQYPIISPPHLPTSYGTYHCLYLLDDKLIAVGVLDILPKCITTVYFFYEPKYSFLNLGVYSALVEISLVRQLSRYCSDESDPLYYHLGFYVHECKKMHYKTRFRPSYLLCSEAKRYVPTETCLKKLHKNKYARFCDESIPNYDASYELCLDSVLKLPVKTPVSTSYIMLDYINWLMANLDKNHAEKLMHCVLQYIRLVGQDLSTKMILEINVIHRILVRMHQSTQ